MMLQLQIYLGKKALRKIKNLAIDFLKTVPVWPLESLHISPRVHISQYESYYLIAYVPLHYEPYYVNYLCHQSHKLRNQD